MKRLVRCLLLFALGVPQHAFAGGIVHIADGDCASLTAAAGAMPGWEPALIVLARQGSYDCFQSLAVRGNITIDGAGATYSLLQSGGGSDNTATPPLISVASGATLTLRNANLGTSATIATTSSKALPGPKFCCHISGRAIENAGNLTLDSVSIHGTSFGSAFFTLAVGFFHNSGALVLRNVSIVDNVYSAFDHGLLTNTGSVDISQSTIVSTAHGFALALLAADSGTISISNSVIANNGTIAAPNCVIGGGSIISRGGNIISDTSCGFSAQNDRVVADARLLDFGTHGGVVGTLALNYDSPAIGNGLAANCEATDARGLARGQDRCDSGAYEIGGGNGKLSATGMSGLYFNAANNGHYISIQRLYGNDALVIWNTFDQSGTPAWLYGVGTVGGNKIHVGQVAQNIGGTLHAGGGVTGATPTLWGTLDVDLSDCYTASLSYSSPLPRFGSGSTSLQRLAFLDGVNCAL